MQIKIRCGAYFVSPSFALFLWFCHSFQSATIAALPSILRIFLFFLLWSCYLGLCLSTSAPDTLPLSLMVAAPSLARPGLLHSLCSLFCKLMWRLCVDAGLSAMWSLPCRTCILIFIEQIEQPNEILIVCHVCVCVCRLVAYLK